MPLKSDTNIAFITPSNGKRPPNKVKITVVTHPSPLGKAISDFVNQFLYRNNRHST